MKKVLIWLVILAVCMTVLYTGFLKINASLIGVFTVIPDQTQGFENYIAHKRKMLAAIRTCSFDEFRQEQLEDLEYEIRYLEILNGVIKKMSGLRQLGG